MLQYSNLFGCLLYAYISYMLNGVVTSFFYPIAICKDFPQTKPIF